MSKFSIAKMFYEKFRDIEVFGLLGEPFPMFVILRQALFLHSEIVFIKSLNGLSLSEMNFC